VSDPQILKNFETPEHFAEIGDILDGSAPWLDSENGELFPERDPAIEYGVLLDDKKGRTPGAVRCRDYADVWNHLQGDGGVKAAWMPQMKYGVPWFLLPGVAAPDEKHMKARLIESLKKGAIGVGLGLYGIFNFNGSQSVMMVMIGIFLVLPALDAFLQWITFPRKLTPQQLYHRWVKGNLFQNWMVGRSTGKAAYPVYGLLAVLAAVYVVQLLQSKEFSLFGVGFQTILDAGLLKDRVLENGEKWRLLTSGVLHGSLVHIWFNGYALFHTGRVVIALSSAWHLAIVFLASILGGSLMSLALNGPVTVGGAIFYRPSVGASGGIMGVVGFLLFWALVYRDSIPHGFAKLLIRNVLIIAIMGIIGMQFIDNAGHFGGFVTGIAVAAIIRPRRKDWWSGEPSKWIDSLGIVSVAVLAWTVFRAILALTAKG